MGSRKRMTSTLAVAILALVAVNELAAQSTPPIKRQASYSVFGCATPSDPADPSFCFPSRWYFRQGFIPDANPIYMEWAVWFPTFDCAYGYPDAFGIGVPVKCDEFFDIPSFGPGWRFATALDFRVFTTDGRLLWTQNDGDFYTPFDWDVNKVSTRIWGYDTRIVPDRWTDFRYTATVTPEPATLTLLAIGLGGVGAGFRARRKRRE